MAGSKAPEQLRKITIATCLAAPSMELLARLEKKGQGSRADVLDVIGIATKFKPGTSDKGEYVKFIGQFQAKNLETGDEFISGAAIFPKMIEESLWGVMGQEVTNVRFGYRIGVKYDRDAATKYVYVATPLTKPAENDALKLLAAEIADTIKALPAPK